MPWERISSATASALSCCTSATTIPAAPASARASAIPRPMPLPAPVTTAPDALISIPLPPAKSFRDCAAASSAANDKWVSGIRLSADPYRFRIHPLPDCVDASLVAHAASLIAAKWRGRAADAIRVDPHGSGLKALGGPQRAPDIRSPDARREAIRRV